MKEIVRLWLKGGFSMYYVDQRGFSGNYTTYDKLDPAGSWKDFTCVPEANGVRIAHKSICDVVIPWHKIDFFWEREVVVPKPKILDLDVTPATTRKGADAPKGK